MILWSIFIQQKRKALLTPLSWGRTWTDTELANGTFRLRLDKNPSVDNLFVDYLRVKVYYTTGGGSATTTVAYIHTDHLGGSSVVTDDHGELVQTLDYYPFGGTRIDNQESNFSEKRQFTGYEKDYSTGLNYAGARYQNPSEGRFISQDPVFWENQNLENPQSLNSYSYAENNPIIKSDPTGRCPWCLPFLAGGIGGWVGSVRKRCFGE